MDTAELYLRFAVREVREHSPAYENLARGIAADARLLALIDELPPIKRQPNLLLASVRFLGGPVADFAPFRSWVVRHWAEVRDTILTRRTQTNEVGRCASLLPVLAGLAQPLALIEVGASAGLCLYPDRYRYHYDDLPAVGPADSPVVLACRTNGKVPVPGRVPEVVWRAGLDLNPLDVRDEEEMRWLECLVWPGQDERLLRLRGAIRVAREDPPHLVRGDLNETLRDLVALAPRRPRWSCSTVRCCRTWSRRRGTGSCRPYGVCRCGGSRTRARPGCPRCSPGLSTASPRIVWHSSRRWTGSRSPWPGRTANG